MYKLTENGFEFVRKGAGCEQIYGKKDSDTEIVVNRCLGEVRATKPCDTTDKVCKTGKTVILKRYFDPHTFKVNMNIFTRDLEKLEE